MSIIFKKNQLMFLLMLAMFVFALFQPNFAFAQEGNLNNSPIARGLCNLFELAGGNIGKAIAIFAIVAVGFGFFTGKFSIALVIGITLGIGILFGAPKIISALTGTDAVDCNSVGTGDDVPCPFKIEVVGPLAVSNSNNNITLSSNGMNLARISCAVASTDKTDIRPQLTPLTSSSVTRTAQVSGTGGFISAASSGTMATTSIDNSSSVSLINARMAADTTFTVGVANFCPGIALDLTYDIACSSKVFVAVSGTGATGSQASGALCVPSSKNLITSGTNLISGSNATHYGTLAQGSAGGKVTIKPGFLGDTRTYALGTRKITATCREGNWVLTTDSTVAPASASATNTATVPANSDGVAPVNIQFTP